MKKVLKIKLFLIGLEIAKLFNKTLTSILESRIFMISFYVLQLANTRAKIRPFPRGCYHLFD